MSKRELYRDILSEGSAADFEDIVFRETIGTARRARRVRTASRCALAGVLAVGIISQFRSPEVEIARAPEQAPEIAVSHNVLKTQPYSGVVRTGPLVERLRGPSSAGVLVLKTGEADSPSFRLIDDAQLLAFFSGRPVALVQRGPHDAELQFMEETR
jgi:hypothetical protein